RPPVHYSRLSSLFDLSVSQSSRLLLLHFSGKHVSLPESTFAHPRYSLGGHRPSQTASYTLSPLERISLISPRGRYFIPTSTLTGIRGYKFPPTLRSWK